MASGGKRFHRSLHATLWLAVFLVAVLLATRDTRPRAEPRPLLWLWAWERFEDLRFLDPRRTGVAYLAATVRLGSDAPIWTGRAQGMRLAPGTPLLAVVRIEGTGSTRGLAQRLAGLPRGPEHIGLQIDWDAPRSMRPAYRALLGEIRRELPDSLTLSMTALASWCTGDCWLGGMPVDEVAPMVFRMGADDGRVRAELARNGDFPCSECRSAVGLSTDEPWPRLRERRVYLFHAGPWTPDLWQRAVKRLERSRSDGE